MPALQVPEDWASAGAVPAAANAARASANKPYLLSPKLFFMTSLLLPITPGVSAQADRSFWCATHQHFEEERGLLRQIRHDCASVLLREVSQPRDLTDAGKKIKSSDAPELEISVSCS
jgi:hypothetical protein